MELTINNIKYNYNNDIGELNLFDWYELQMLFNEKQKVKIDEFTDGELFEKELDEKDETEEFKFNKCVKILLLLSNIPEGILREIDTTFIDMLLNELVMFNSNEQPFTLKRSIFDDSNSLRLHKGLVSIREDNSTEIKLDGFKDKEWCYIFTLDSEEELMDNDWYCIPLIDDLSFQEWTDIDNFSKDNLANIFKVLIKKVELMQLDKSFTYKSKPYNRLHSDTGFKFKDKELIISYLKVKDMLSLLLYYFNQMNDVKNEFTYVYGNYDVKSSPSPNYDKFSKIVGWEDSIGKLAELPVFNSSKGTLYAIRNSNFIDVLEYFNIKRGRDIAECKDYEVNQNKQK